MEDIEEDGDDISDTYSLRGEACYGSHLHDGESLSELFFDLVSAIPIFFFLFSAYWHEHPVPVGSFWHPTGAAGTLLLDGLLFPFPSYPHRHRQLPKYEDEFMVHCYRLREPFSGGEKMVSELEKPLEKTMAVVQRRRKKFFFIRLNEGRARCQTPTRHRRLLFCFFSSSCSSLIILLKRRSTNQK